MVIIPALALRAFFAPTMYPAILLRKGLGVFAGSVDFSKTVVVIKRSLSPGFAGIPNPLFAADNALMLFGDGKKMVDGIVKAVKES